MKKIFRYIIINKWLVALRLKFRKKLINKKYGSINWSLYLNRNLIKKLIYIKLQNNHLINN